MNLSRGSIWRKWDLHIHTPKSIENTYGGDNDDIWEQFITCLENLPEEVKVIGINDYYFIDGFEKVMDYKMNKNRLKNIEKIFPVLEFRIDTFAAATGTKFDKVNLHILFDIDDDKWKKEVDKIRTEFTGVIHLSKLPQHTTKFLSKTNLIECGGNLKDGFEGIIPSTEEVMDIINADAWKGKVFTFLGYKEWDNLEKNQQLKDVKKQMYSLAQAFFTGTPTDDVKKKEGILKIFGNKPLFHSPDIHRFSEFERENYKCFTWIKADCTFEGLKQVIYEPNERIRIQNIHPDYMLTKSTVIEEVQITNNDTNNWFMEENIPLNRGLVSIIGEKGAGKTALLDLIAIANKEGIYEQDEKTPYSFYNRAKQQLKDTRISIKHEARDAVECILTGQSIKGESDKYADVRYLSLKELEGYCDKKEKFQQFMKDIILEKYESIVTYQENSMHYVNEIKRISNEKIALEEKDKDYDRCVLAIQSKEADIEAHIKKEPKIQTNFTETQAQEYRELLTKKQECQNHIDRLEKSISEYEEFTSWVKKEVEQTRVDLEQRIYSKYHQISTKDEVLWGTYQLGITTNIIDQTQQKIVFLQTQINPIKTEIELLQQKITPLEEINKHAISEMELTKQWIDIESELEKELQQHQEQMLKLKENRKQIQILGSQIESKYADLLLNKIKQRLKYGELKDELADQSNITFDVKIEFNEERFWDKEAQLINHNAGNSHEKIKEQLTKNFLTYLKVIDDIGEDENLEEKVREISRNIQKVYEPTFIEDNFGDKKSSGLLKKGNKINDYFEWLLDDYYEVNYFIKFKGRPLETLSPGQKGLVLMKIFLMLDQGKKPLLIDQPEDNLDNKSVFDDLVADFRQIKQKRQIIIATHNPNLVINTDSEQVIVAQFEDNPIQGEPRIKYTSGSIENKEIRNLICGILEGGDSAFLKREERYNLSKRG